MQSAWLSLVFAERGWSIRPWSLVFPELIAAHTRVAVTRVKVALAIRAVEVDHRGSDQLRKEWQPLLPLRVPIQEWRPLLPLRVFPYKSGGPYFRLGCRSLASNKISKELVPTIRIKPAHNEMPV